MDEQIDQRKMDLEWCKGRALEYVVAGDLQQAYASFASDLRKFDSLKSAAELHEQLGFPLLLNGHLDTDEKMRRWIEGFN